MRILCLSLVLLLNSQYVYASDDEGDASWADIARRAAESAIEEVKAIDMPEPLVLTSIEHDLKCVHKPASLYFQCGDLAYRLSDNDGGATILLMYAICMNEVHKMLLGKTESAARKSWKNIKKKNIQAFPLINSLMKHAINRMLAQYGGAYYPSLFDPCQLSCAGDSINKEFV